MKVVLSATQIEAMRFLESNGSLDDGSSFTLGTMRALKRKGLVNLSVWPAYAHMYGPCIGYGWQAQIRTEENE